MHGIQTCKLYLARKQKSFSRDSLRSRGAKAVRPCASGYMVCCEPAALPLRGERLGGDQSSAHGALEVTMMGGGAGPTHQPLLRRRHAACTELACKRTRNLFLRWRVAPVVVCLAFRMDTRNCVSETHGAGGGCDTPYHGGSGRRVAAALLGGGHSAPTSASANSGAHACLLLRG